MPGWKCGWPLTGTRSPAGPRAGSISVTTLTADGSWRPRDLVRLEASEAASVPRPGWRKRALAVRERGRWRTARGPAPRRTGTAAGGALAVYAAVRVAVVATVKASRDVVEQAATGAEHQRCQLRVVLPDWRRYAWPPHRTGRRIAYGRAP
jgi:hypothetical protein